MIVVPQPFATDTIIREGDEGREWIDALPNLVESLCNQWNLIVDGPPMHGYLGLVIPARRRDEPCVLKVSWIDESTVEEEIALAAWNGQGAVRLLDAQPNLGALLLERLDSQRSLNNVGIAEAVDIAGRLLRRLSIQAPTGLRSLHTVTQTLHRTLPERWERYGRPMPHRLLEQACDRAIQLGASTQSLLVNYDLHYIDVLASKREPWLVVDPKVVVGDPEFGVAQLLWCRLEDMQAQGGLDRHFRMLTEAAMLDFERARSWTLVRCVDYWLWGLSVGLTEDPARCETILNWLA